MDKTAKDLVWIISNSDNIKRRNDAVHTLLAILPSLDQDTVDKIIHEMMWIISNSDNEGRRTHAQEVLVPYKLMGGA